MKKILTLDRLLFMEIHCNHLHVDQLRDLPPGRLDHIRQVLEHASVRGQVGRQLQNTLERMSPAAADINEKRPLVVSWLSGGLLDDPSNVIGA